MTLIHETLLVSLPCLYAIFFDFHFEKSLRFSFSPYDLLNVLFIENVYILCFLLPFLLFLKLYKRPHEALIPGKLYSFLALITFIGIIVYIYQIINRPTIEQIVESYSQSGLNSSVNPFVAFFTITFEHTAIISASLLSIKGKKENYSKFYQYLGWIMLFLVVFLVIVSGVRGRIIWVAEFVVIVSVFKRNLKPIILMIPLVLALIPLNNILLEQIRPISEEIAKEGGLTNKALVNIARTIISGVNDKNKLEGPSLLESFAERAQGPRNSIVMIREYDEGNAPGLNIYTGAIFYFTPRVLFDRPVIGSPNGDFQDAAIFKVMNLNYDTSFITMGPLLASAHAYWEGGYLAVVLIGLITCLLWILLLRFCYRYPLPLGFLVCLLGCCALLIDGFVTALSPLYAMISIFWKNFLPLCLLYCVFVKIKWPNIVLKF